MKQFLSHLLKTFNLHETCGCDLLMIRTLNDFPFQSAIDQPVVFQPKSPDFSAVLNLSVSGNPRVLTNAVHITVFTNFEFSTIVTVEKWIGQGQKVFNVIEIVVLHVKHQHSVPQVVTTVSGSRVFDEQFFLLLAVKHLFKDRQLNVRVKLYISR